MAPYSKALKLCISTLLLTQFSVQGKFELRNDKIATSVERSSNRGLGEARIVGGSRPNLDEYPWFARATVGSQWGGCGGSLVSPEYVLTAAHCIYDYFRTNGGYEIGSYCGEADNCDQKEEAFRIRTITLHPGYDDTISSDNDFALVRLKGTSTITPVQMDGDGVSLSDNYSAGKAVWAIGFGTTEYEGSASEDILDVEVKYETNAQCNREYNPIGISITANMICAADTEKDSCQGDSGGPLFDKENDTLVGVVSFGAGCADPRFSGVYARILNQKAWIQDTICANHNAPKPAFCVSQPPTCGMTAVIVTVDTDNFPQEISWQITGGTTISSPEYLDIDTKYVHEYCVDNTKCYTFTIFDDYGDGIISPGGYSVEVDGKPIDGLGDAFTKSDSAMFGSCNSNDSSDVRCPDSTLNFLVNRKSRNCDWVKFNPTARCKKKGVKSLCPHTCDSYDFCTKDGSKRFELDNGNFRSCKWVGKVKDYVVKRCAIAGVSETCRESCFVTTSVTL